MTHADLDAALSALALTPKQNLRKCSVGTWLEGMDPTDRGKVEQFLNDPNITPSRIEEHLKPFGCPAAHTVRRHRRRTSAGGCQCPA